MVKELVQSALLFDKVLDIHSKTSYEIREQCKMRFHEQRKQINEFGSLLLSMFTGALFLVVWVVIQWGASTVISPLEPTGIDRYFFLIFQVLLGLSTLILVLFWIVRDIARQVAKTRLVVLEARGVLESTPSDLNDSMDTDTTSAQAEPIQDRSDRRMRN